MSHCVIKHVKANKLLSEEQHGFTQGKSVTTNLLKALNVWTEALSHNIPVDILYLDYQKAFDCVPHERLINQVESFGITGDALKWLRAFLTDRRQKVIVNGSESAWSGVLSGVPQGSILGPVLFSLFVDDLPNSVQSLISLFADDTKLYLPIPTDEEVIQLAEDLATLERWAYLRTLDDVHLLAKSPSTKSQVGTLQCEALNFEK